MTLPIELYWIGSEKRKMLSPVEFTITFEGDFPGQRESSLSLSTFQETLKYLLKAVQYSAMASEPKIAKRQFRRIRKGSLGSTFDLQLVDIGDGSIVLTLALMPVDPSIVLTQDFVEKSVITANTFLREVKDGATSIDESASPIKNYLKSIPQTVKTQNYLAEHNGSRIGEFTLSQVDIDPELKNIPHIKSIHGVIDTIRFAPKHEHIMFKDESGDKYNCKVTSQQIDAAIVLKNKLVVAKVVVSGKGNTLISLNANDHEYSYPDKQSRENHIFSKWAGLLRRLAQ